MDSLWQSTHPITVPVLGMTHRTSIPKPMTTIQNQAKREQYPHKPILTWGAVCLLPFAVAPFIAMANGADPRGLAGDLAAFAFYGAPLVGLVLLMGAWQRKERARILAGFFISLYGLWTIALIGLLILGMMFGKGNNW
jgi:hypothetical protein